MVWLYGFAIWWAAAIAVAATFHLMKKKIRERTVIVTWVTRGRKYHKSEQCPLMTGGENLWDGDGEDYFHTSGAFRREVASIEYAAYLGKLPCLYCVPLEERVMPPLYGQTFGHEPVLISGDLFCGKCRDRGVDEDGDPWSYPSLWPCTSAVVLGLKEKN